MAKGFFEGILKDIMLAGVVEASRDNSGKPDPYKAAGIAMGFGHTSLEDQMRLATMLGAEGAFDPDVSSGEVFITPRVSEAPLPTAVSYDWRNTDMGSEYNILPEDFDSEEEFLAAIEEAELDALTGVYLSSEDERAQIYSISIIPDDAGLHEREIATRQYLYNKYSQEYPHVFTKDFLDQSYYDMGVRASKKVVSVELPYIMLLDLIANHNVFGLGIFYLLLAGNSKKCIDACRKYLPKILDIVERLEFDDTDFEALLAFIQGKVFLEMHELGAACTVLQSIRRKHPELVQDDIFVSFCMETVDFLTDGTIKASFDSKMRYLRLCADMVESLSSKNCYKKAVERTYAENEAQQLVFRFRPNDKKTLLFWDVGDDFMDDLVFSMITAKDNERLFSTFSTLLNDQTLTKRQKEWVEHGFEHLLLYSADGCSDEIAYSYFLGDVTFKEAALGGRKNIGRFIGHLMAMSVRNCDISTHKELMSLYEKIISTGPNHGEFIKFLNQDLECVYIDPFCDSADKFSDYLLIENNLTKIVKDHANRAKCKHICRLCEDINHDYSLFAAKLERISLTETKFNELTRKVENIIQKLEDGKLWRRSSPGKKQYWYYFKYPDGKNGDIDMYLASKCGDVLQIDPITYRVSIAEHKRDYFPLLVSPYFHADSTNDGIRRYLCQENYLFQLQTELENLERFAVENSYRDGVELAVSEKLLLSVSKIQQAYGRMFSQQREDIYQTLAQAGLLTTKWVSEYQVFTIANSLYPDAIYQYHSEWLGNQSLDIFIPSLNVGIEYQGAQHYRAVELFGGEDGLRERKKLDIRKKRLCKENGIKLVEIKYTEEISVELVKSKIDAVL